ncbi:MAG: tRNA (adenosine(37)-N6)-dimethylallyltransferase MiaA [Reichenbachiella sp.]
MMNSNKILVVIVGPTAVGKTMVSIDLALKFRAEIVSADSRQFYKEMEIGTAKPTAKEMATVPHHLIDTLHIDQDYDAGQFVVEANRIVEKQLESSDTVIMVGGSGLYVKAFCDGLNEMPQIPKEIRAKLNQEFADFGLVPLLAELEKGDPSYFEVVDQKNPQRIIRGLEVIRTVGKPFSFFRNQSTQIQHPFKIIKIGLEMDRENLYKRIEQRMDQMIDMGLFTEAKSLFQDRNYNSLKTVGYQEIFGFLEGKYDKDEAIRLLKRNSRRYAKRQLTWFKKDEEIRWFNPKDLEGMEQYIESIRSLS